MLVERRRDVARKAIDALKHVNAPILGAVLNRIPRTTSDYYYYYHYYEEREGRAGRRMDATSPLVAAKGPKRSVSGRERAVRSPES